MSDYQDIDFQQAREILDREKDSVLLDVREEEEFIMTGKTVAFCHCQLGAKERTQSRKRRTLHLYNLCGLCSDA